MFPNVYMRGWQDVFANLPVAALSGIEMRFDAQTSLTNTDRGPRLAMSLEAGFS
jgi:hypothetical protein